MLVLEANHIKKYFADRLIFEVENLMIYKGDRIGIVGLNGAGKTTLMKVLAKEIDTSEGTVKLYGTSSYIRQLEDGDGEVDRQTARGFGVDGRSEEHMSGGERTRMKIARSLSLECDMLFADEPTCNLDMKGIKLLEEHLKRFKGAIVVISHDRTLLDNICSRILEIEDGKVRVFKGNYSGYKKLKGDEFNRQMQEYEGYVKTRKQLEDAAKALVNRANRFNGISVNDFQRGKAAKVAKKGKALMARIEKLEKREKPRDAARTRIDLQEVDSPVSKTLVDGQDISKSFGARKLFEGFNFQIPRNKKVALIGDNGTGKTTFINMILCGEGGIKTAKDVRIGYFSQSLDILDEDRSILQNVMAESIYPEAFARTVLARLLFRRDDVYKAVRNLSGGEKVKAAFAKTFLKDINLLILDEPTNYLDIYSQEALEQVLKEYDGTLLFTSHDRRFVNEVADCIILLENGKGIMFEGNYDQYLEFEKVRENSRSSNLKIEMLLLENRLAEVTGRLSAPSKTDDVEALDMEFKDIVSKLKSLKE